jgi:hypothetical protein
MRLFTELAPQLKHLRLSGARVASVVPTTPQPVMITCVG